ncbi:alpha-L-rhamnosidase-related protein [Coraliomargarita sp. W4R53]
MTRSGGLAAEIWEQADNEKPSLVSVTDHTWKVEVDRSRQFQPGKLNWFGGFVGHFEQFVATEETFQNWEQLDFDDSSWPEATALYPAERIENIADAVSPYGLMPRKVPMERHLAPEVPIAVFRPDGDKECQPDFKALLLDGAKIEIAPHSQQNIIIEYGKEWTGFPELTFSKGADATIRVGYAEALRIDTSVADAVIFGRGGDTGDVAIGFEDNTSGWSFDHRGRFEGFEDIIECDGREWHWQPHHWRTAKFIRLQIQTNDQALTLSNFQFCPCHYPLDEAAPFTCSDSQLKTVHETSMHTLKLSMHETFIDCPYFEQLQYIGDSALNARAAMLTCGAYAASEQLILHFDWSRVPEGWTQSRYPSRIEGIIPAQSLDWISAIRDYALYSGQLGTVRTVWPGAQVVLDAYQRQIGARGLPEKLPYWNWVDWCPGWKRGVPPGAETGPVLSHAAKFGHALVQAIEVAGWLDDAFAVEKFTQQHRSLKHAARDAFWQGKYFSENTEDTSYGSRLGNAYAILAGFAHEDEYPQLLAAMTNDQLADCSFFGYYFVRQALWQLGEFDYQQELAPWFKMADLGLSTWAEDTTFWRSLCHGWSANPVIDFTTQILGVQPSIPGFGLCAVKPQLGLLQDASGGVATPHGSIKVSWKDHGHGGLEVEIPQGVIIECLTIHDQTLTNIPAGKHSFKAAPPAHKSTRTLTSAHH